MDLFQLERAIGKLEYDNALFGDYQPFLGVVNYDLSDDLIKTRLKDLCRKATCCENLYFFVLNTSFSTEDGEHWFLLAFKKAIMQVFYSFNSYGIVSTLNTFGVPKQEVLDSRKRLDVLQSMSKNIWGNHQTTTTTTVSNNINVIGLNGIHQDFSTDECGYHVYRFVSYLYDKILLLVENNNNNDWNEILERYLREYGVVLVPYSYKNLVKNVAQPILLENDKLVRRFWERGNSAPTIDNRIEEHDEHNLTETDWRDKAQEFLDSIAYLPAPIESIRQHEKTDFTITIPVVVDLPPTFTQQQQQQQQQRNQTTMSDAARKRKKRIRTRQFSGGAKSDFDSPYKRNVNPITGQHYVTSFDDTFEELYKKTQTSVSREILQNLFPTQVSNKLNPLLNNIQFSGMVDDPDY